MTATSSNPIRGFQRSGSQGAPRARRSVPFWVIAGALFVSASCSTAEPDDRGTGTSTNLPSPSAGTADPTVPSFTGSDSTRSGSTGSEGSASASTLPASSPAAVTVVAGELTVPWGIVPLPNGEILVGERDSGRLSRVAGDASATTGATTAPATTTIGTLQGVDSGAREGGLSAMAASPTFPADRLIYAYLTAAEDNRVVRFELPDSPTSQPIPAEVVLSGIPRGSIHNGGGLAFGPDGLLYVGTGDTGDRTLSQNPDSLGGKILRITTSGAAAAGNPFGSPVFTLGHRNVQGLAWDADGRMFASELGQNAFDELNRIEVGKNYGWPEVEGADPDPRFVEPVATWTTADASPSGLAFADGSLWMAALRGKRLWEIPVDPASGVTGSPVPHLVDTYGRLRGVAAGPTDRGTQLWVGTTNADATGGAAAGSDLLLHLVPGLLD